MRAWTADESRLVEASRRVEEQRKAQELGRKRLIRKLRLRLVGALAWPLAPRRRLDRDREGSSRRRRGKQATKIAQDNEAEAKKQTQIAKTNEAEAKKQTEIARQTPRKPDARPSRSRPRPE